MVVYRLQLKTTWNLPLLSLWVDRRLCKIGMNVSMTRRSRSLTECTARTRLKGRSYFEKRARAWTHICQAPPSVCFIFCSVYHLWNHRRVDSVIKRTISINWIAYIHTLNRKYHKTIHLTKEPRPILTWYTLYTVKSDIKRPNLFTIEFSTTVTFLLFFSAVL